MRRLCLVLLVGICVAPVFAQAPALQADKLGFDQAASSLVEAQGFRYTVYLDGSLTGTVLTATCAGVASPFICTAPLPPVTPGQHTAELTAAVVMPDGRSAESAKSAPFLFQVYLAPAVPGALRIVP